jgi:hypothetical protein
MQEKRKKLIYPAVLIKHAQKCKCDPLPNEKSDFMFFFIGRYGKRVAINGRRPTTLTSINEDCDALGIRHLTEEECEDYIAER